MKSVFLLGVCLLSVAIFGEEENHADEPASSEIKKVNLYIDAGVPASDRVWNGHDYLVVQKVLSAGTVRLPGLKNQEGKSIFTRLTNVENLSSYQRKTIPITLRFPEYLQMTQAFNNILMLYIMDANRGENLNDEIADLMVFTLELHVLGMQLTNEFVPTIAKDESYEIRMQGLKQMYGGVMTSFTGVEVSLHEKNFYSEANISTMLTGMDKTLPGLLQAFSEEFKEEMKKKLTANLDLFDGQDEALLKSMIKTLDESLNKDEGQ